MASKTTPCQLVETASAARHGTRLIRPDGQSLLSLWPSDSVGSPSLRTTTPRDAVHSLRYTNVVGLGRWIVIPGGRNGAVTTAHQDNNRGCDPPNWAATDKSLRKHNGNGRGWRAAELLLLCHCVSRGVCPFMRSSTRCHCCASRLGWYRQDSNPEATVVRPLGDMCRRDGPRPPKRSSRDDGDLRRVRERHACSRQ